jgi:3-dehydroquinate dehydratase type I
MKLAGRDTGELRLPLWEASDATKRRSRSRCGSFSKGRGMGAPARASDQRVGELPAARAMTHLCVAIFVTSVDQAKRDAARAAEAGADLVELRIDRYADGADRLTDPDVIGRLVREVNVPCVVTHRPTWEGGESAASDEERLALLGDAAEHGAAYLDVELRTLGAATALTTLPRESRPGLIASSHDFAGRPDRLYNIIADLNAAPADVNKIVWAARTIRDNLEAFELLQHRQKPTIALCMGEAGLISRVLRRSSARSSRSRRSNPAAAPRRGRCRSAT